MSPSLLSGAKPAFQQNSVTPNQNTAPFSAQKPQTNQFGQLTSLMPKATSPLSAGSLNLNAPSTASLGVRATAPGSNVTAPKTTLPVAQTAPKAQQPVPQQAQQPTFAGAGNTGSIIPGGASMSTMNLPPGGTPTAPTSAVQSQGGTPTAPTNMALSGTNNPGSIVSLLTGGQTQASGGLNNIQNQLQQTSTASSPAATQDQSQLQQYAAQNTALEQNAQNINNQYYQEYQTALNGAARQLGPLAGGAGPVGSGLEGAAQNTLNAYLQNLTNENVQGLAANAQALTGVNQASTATSNAANAANTQQSNVQSGLNQAGGIAAQSQGQQLGALGQAAGNVPGALQYGAYGGGGNLAPQSVATQLAQLVNSGQMTSDQANTQMTSLYGGAGSTFLQQALTGAPGATGGAGAVNPNFNYVQSAQNQASQGQLGPQSTQASLDYSNLQSALQNVPSFEQTGVPVINAIGNLMSSMGLLGSGAQSSTQALNSAISTTRAAVETALSTQYGGTPSDYSSQATSLFPPNLTPAQLSAGMQQFQVQMGIRQQAYGSPGTTPITTSVGGASTASTDYNF